MRKKVVVIGGGTGTFPVICGLKHEDLTLSAVIAVSDSGGSTGKIRDEFGFQAVGDLRQSLAALAESEGEEWIRKILLYRFTTGTGLKGHNLGNLILTALQDMTGDTSEALDIAEKVFRLEGNVIPATAENVELQILYDDGSTAVGEHLLNPEDQKGKKVKKISLIPNAPIHPLAASAIQTADMVVIGPGDYFASIMAVLQVKGMKKVVQESHAKFVYIVNLMTRANQTDGMDAQAHVVGIEEVLGKCVDAVIMNSAPIPQSMIEKYAMEKEFPVKDDLGKGKRVLRADVLSDEAASEEAGDSLHRSLLRHDSQKLRQVLMSLL
jgi:uncharacterized cofD-like protein